jgi:hypothetical protein
MFTALRLVTLVEVLVALVAVAAGLGIVGLGHALSALREVALNTRTIAYGPNRPAEPTYGALELVASVLVGVGAVVALIGVVGAFWFFLA